MVRDLLKSLTAGPVRITPCRLAFDDWFDDGVGLEPSEMVGLERVGDAPVIKTIHKNMNQRFVCVCVCV